MSDKICVGCGNTLCVCNWNTDDLHDPKPEASSELLVPVKVVSKEELKKLYPEAPTMAEIHEPLERAHEKLFTERANAAKNRAALPAVFTNPPKDAGASYAQLLEAKVESLQRELAEAKERADTCTKMARETNREINKERTRSAALVGALGNISRGMPNDDIPMGYRQYADSILAKWGKE